MKVLLLENIHPSAVKALEAFGMDVRLVKGAMDEDELIEALDGVDVLGIRSKTQVSRRVLEARPDLMAIGAFCIGTNQIDLQAASDTATAVFNAPYSNTRSVVELAIAEIIALARHMTDRSSELHRGVWNKSAKGSHEIRGRKLGIVGYGNIGSQLSVIAEAMGMQVYFYDVVDRLALGNAHKCTSLQQLLETAEVISLHVDGRAENTNLFGPDEFAMMRERSLFLNLCRGSVVDLDALRDSLVSGHIAGAAVDVFPEEPKSNAEPFLSVLQGVPNVILTPHVGGSTQEAQEDIGHFVSTKILDYVGSGSTNMSVNVPELHVDSHIGRARLLHLHRNVPGVLATVNGVLGRHGVNIERQQLATRGELGYVVTDTLAPLDRALIDELLAMPETIRLATIG